MSEAALEETASYKIDRFFKTMDPQDDKRVDSDDTALYASRDTKASATGESQTNQFGVPMATMTESNALIHDVSSDLYEELLTKQIARRMSRENSHQQREDEGVAVNNGSPNRSLEDGRRSTAAPTPNGAAPALMPAPLITKRTTPILSRAPSGGRSETNGHSHTPVVGERRSTETRHSRGSHDFQEALKVDELAAKVEALTKVLGEREAENVALTTKVETLQEENEKLRRQMPSSAASTSHSEYDSGRLQQKVDQLLTEKEILSQELTEARQEIETLSRMRETAQTKPLTSSFEFDRNNPATLRRKVEELENQIQDLQEANESTAVLLANYQPPLSMEKPRDGLDFSRNRLPNSEADSLRREIESLRSELMVMRQKNEMPQPSLRDPSPARSNLSDLQRYEKERNNVLEDMHRLRQDLREDQLRSTRLSGAQLRSHSYANLTSYERPPTEEHDNELRSPYVESKSSNEGSGERRTVRKLSSNMESHQRSSSSSRLPNPLPDSHGKASKPEETDARSSGSTSSILSDADRELEELKMMVSRSYKMENTDPTASLRRSGKSPLPSPPAGLRTVSPPPIPTQHNRTNLIKSGYNPDADRESAFATIGRHPFAPRNAADIQLRDIVKFTRQGGRICKGLVHFVGHLPGRNDVYIGVELEHEDGKHDGTYEGRRYFQCKTNKGVFVAFNKVIMCYGVRPV